METCKFPYVEPVVWKCPACNEARPRTHKGHDPYRDKPGERRLADPLTDTRRIGSHPRAPRAPTTEHPTADMSTYDQTRKDEDESIKEAPGIGGSSGIRGGDKDGTGC